MLTAFVAALTIGVQTADSHCRVQLFVDEQPRFQLNQIRVALRFQMDDGWHVYWRNPGDSGAAPEVKWTLPKGWTSSPIVWPKPSIHVESGMTTFIYEKEVILSATISTTGPVVGQPIIADVSWLVCQDACIPGSVRVKTHIQSRSSSESRQVIQDAINSAPKRLDSIVASHSESKISIIIPSFIEPSDWKFLPNDDDVLDYGAPQFLSHREGQLLEAPKGPLFKKDKKRLRGALISTNDYFIFDVPLSAIAGDKP